MTLYQRKWTISLATSLMAIAIAMGDQDATSAADRQKTMEKLHRITIKQLEISDMRLKDIVRHLEKISIDNDTADVPRDQKGVRIVLELDLINKQAYKSHTLSAANVSLHDALQTIAQIANVKWVVGKNEVRIMAPDAGIITRSYKKDASFPKLIRTWNEAMNAETNPSNRRRTTSDSDEMKEFFRKSGVSWPEGSSIEYRAGEGKLVVSNEADNLARVEVIMENLAVNSNGKEKKNSTTPPEKR